MHPILFEIAGFQIPMYGALLAASFLVALRVGLALARREGIAPEPIMNLWLWLLLSGVLGAKALLYLTDLQYYLRNPGAFVGSLRSAGVFYGGIITGLVVGIVYVRRHALPVWKCLDLSAPALALANSIGRLGCLAAGCCWGRPTRLAWGITFRDPQARAITGVPLDLPLHPTQVLLSLTALGVFMALLALYRRKSFDGQIFAAYLMIEPASRFLVEFLRADPRGEILGLPTSQALALAGIAAGAWIYLRRSRGAPAVSN